MLHLVEQPAAEITGFESEAKAAQGGSSGAGSCARSISTKRRFACES
jgi:hypothetical protein